MIFQETRFSTMGQCVAYWCNALQPKEKVIPHVIEKILSQNKRCSLFIPSATERAFWDDRLWTFSSKSFIAHGSDIHDETPSDHPVWITPTLVNQNRSEYIIIIEPLELKDCFVEQFSSWIWIFSCDETETFQHTTKWASHHHWEGSWIWKYHNKKWEKNVWM